MDSNNARVMKPDPDPTVLTTQQLLRENSNLKEILTSRIEGIERSITVAHEDLVRVPTQVDKAVSSLKEFIMERFNTINEQLAGMDRLDIEKFAGIDRQFKERDTRVEQTAKASKEALDAALQAAKEAVGVQQQSNSLAINKSEKTTSEQITALGTLIQQTTKTTDDKIADLKDRLTLIAGQSTGRGDMWGWVVGGIGLVTTLVILAVYATRLLK